MFRGSKIFARRYFMGPKFFLVGVLSVPNFFSLVFRGPKIICRAYFVCSKFFLVGISWVQNFFRGFKIFSGGQFRNLKFLTALEKVAQKHI